MIVNDAGMNIIKRFEGLRLRAYRCPAGVWTIGYGHTGPDVVEGMVITEQKANRLLRNDVAYFEEAVSRLVRVPVNENQFSALVSFAFNLGENRLEGSTLLWNLNQGDVVGAAEEFLRWNKAKVNGKLTTLPGLASRREAEQALFFTPV